MKRCLGFAIFSGVVFAIAMTTSQASPNANTNAAPANSAATASSPGSSPAVAPVVAPATTAATQSAKPIVTDINGFLNQNGFKNLYIFGDSLSDPGNILSLTYHAKGGPMPPLKYFFNGRYSNGLIWAEYLAPALNIAPAHVHNYAYAGATIADGNIANANNDFPNFQKEVSLFLQDTPANSINSDDSLFVIWVGADNFLSMKPTDFGNPAQYIQTQVSSLVQQIALINDKTLGKQFLVLAVPKVGIAPYMQELLPELNAKTRKAAAAVGAPTPAPITAATLDTFVNGFNQALVQGLQQVATAKNIQIKFLDLNPTLAAALKNPQQWQITNTKQSCYNKQKKTICSNPQDYFFYDHLHPTTTVHNHMASNIFNQLVSRQMGEKRQGFRMG